MTSWLAIICGAIVSVIAYRMLRIQQYNSLARKNGCASPKQYPHKDPIFGFDLFLQAGKMFSEHTFLPISFQRYRENGRTFQTKTLGIPTICSCEPDNLQSVFASNARNWGVSYRLPALNAYCGKGFLTTDGPEWERSRQLFSGSFSRANIKDHTAYEHYVQLMLKQIPGDGSTIDLQQLIFSLYLDTATLFWFGESFESLAKGLTGDAQEFIDSFGYSLGGGGLRMALGPLKFLHHDKKWHESNAQNHAFINKYVDSALERKASGRLGISNSSKRPVLLDLMAEQMDDRIQLRNEATQAFLAAHETTACLISNVIFLLARHPDIQARVRDEVKSIRDTPLDFDAVMRMKYLQNVINEALRFYPVFPYHVRQAFSACILPTGGGSDGKSPIYVQAGTLFDANFAVLHRSPEVWGSDADQFKPDRWESFKPKAWEYVPFGGGSRSCVGKQKALMETSYLIARLLREFKSIESRDEREWVGQVQITAKNLNGCKVALTPADV